MTRRAALFRLALVLLAYLLASWLDAGSDFCRPSAQIDDGPDGAAVAAWCDTR